MELKDNVIPTSLKPETLLAIIITNDVYKLHGHSLTVTSIADGKHARQSLHYVGYAFDARTRMLTDDEIYSISNELRKRLTTDYDVVVESDHLHIEYQPKRP